jgi:hypothetical protein
MSLKPLRIITVGKPHAFWKEAGEHYLERIARFRKVTESVIKDSDPALPTARRVEEEGKRIFFERMFQAALGEDDAKRLAGIPNLAPGDFRTVRQSLYYLGGAVTNATRLDGLEKESSLKKGAARSIGF